MKRKSQRLTVHVDASDYAVITAACAALSTEKYSVSESLLLFTAAWEEAMALTNAPRRGRGVWKHRPERSASTAAEHAVTVPITNPLMYQIISTAAEKAEASLPTFMLGSTFAYIARWKAGAPQNKRLQKIRLPAQYELQKW